MSKSRWSITIAFCFMLVASMIMAGCEFEGDPGTPLFAKLFAPPQPTPGDTAEPTIDGVAAAAKTFQSSVKTGDMMFWTSFDIVGQGQIWSMTYSNQATIYDATLFTNWTNTAGTTNSYTSWSDAYDTFGFLVLDDGVQGQVFEPVPYWISFPEEDYAEWAFPVQTLMGVSVERKMMINPSGNPQDGNVFVRWLEILTNNSGAYKKVNLTIGGDMGSDSSTKVVASADGNTAAAGGVDNWFITADTTANATSANFSDPLVGHLLDGSMSRDMNDTIIAAATTSPAVVNFWTTGWSTTPFNLTTMSMVATTDTVIAKWTGIGLRAGETKIYMHLELLSMPPFAAAGNTISEGVPAAIEDIKALAASPGDVVYGLDADELNKLVNWNSAVKHCNVAGDPGTAAAGAVIYVVNTESDANAKSYAMPDGSFGVCIDANLDDELKVYVDGTLLGSLLAK